MPQHPSKATDGSAGHSDGSPHPMMPPPGLGSISANPCQISSIEIHGNTLPGDVLKISDTMDFSKSKTLATFSGKPGTRRSSNPQSHLRQRRVSPPMSPPNSPVARDRQPQPAKADNSLCGNDPAPNHPEGTPRRILHQRQAESSNAAPKAKPSPSALPPNPGSSDFPPEPPPASSAWNGQAPKTPLSVSEIRVFGIIQVIISRIIHTTHP